MLKRRKFSLLFLVWMLLITYLSLFTLPDTHTEDFWFDHLDKIVHFCIYLIVTLLGFLALKETSRKEFSKSRALQSIFIFAIIYGLLIELFQHLMPFDRMAEIWDVVANTFGALFGCWLIQRYGSLILPLK